MHEDAGGGRTLVELRLQDGKLRRFWGHPGERTAAYRLGGGPVELLIVCNAAEIARKDQCLVNCSRDGDAPPSSQKHAKVSGQALAVLPAPALAKLIREMMDFRDHVVAESVAKAPGPQRQ